MKILIINGVNLDKIGGRETNIYGAVSFDDYYIELKNRFSQVELSYFQSNNLEDLVSAISNSSEFDGIVLNAGAYTHTSIVLADAVRSISTKVVEVHISNLFAREQYRKNSLLAAACSGFISGFGLRSYDLAILSFLH